jgi:hypothetical protein
VQAKVDAVEKPSPLAQVFDRFNCIDELIRKLMPIVQAPRSCLGAVDLRLWSSALLAVLIASGPAVAGQYPTIVGEWYLEDYGPQDCGTPLAVKIGPMSYAEDAYSCTFKDVRRDGWKVTWNGSCSDGSTSEKMKVVAVEDDGRLSMRFNGQPAASTLRRCHATAKGASMALERVPLHYTKYDADSPVAQKYWKDQIDLELRVNPDASIHVAVAESGGMTFAMLVSMGSCGMSDHGCQIRIFEHGLREGEFAACEDTSRHALAGDGARFYACETSGAGRPLSELRFQEGT